MSDSIDWRRLAEPFPPDEIEWRVGNKSKAGDKATLLCYLTSRAVQNRLDEVVGAARWRDSYTPITEGPKTVGFLCTLEIEVAPGVWVGKTDASDTTDIEAIKGGISGALKRAAVKWGIGRYLYGIDTRFYPIRDGYGPDNAVYCAKGPGKGGSPGHIIPPQLPARALPDGTQPARQQRREEPKPKPAPEPAKKADPPKATPKPTEAPEGGHHPSWVKGGNRAFMGKLGDAGIKHPYGVIAAFCESLGAARPSTMTPDVRDKLIQRLTDPEIRAKLDDFAAKPAA